MKKIIIDLLGRIKERKRRNTRREYTYEAERYVYITENTLGDSHRLCLMINGIPAYIVGEVQDPGLGSGQIHTITPSEATRLLYTIRDQYVGNKISKNDLFF